MVWLAGQMQSPWHLKNQHFQPWIASRGGAGAYLWWVMPVTHLQQITIRTSTMWACVNIIHHQRNGLKFEIDINDRHKLIIASILQFFNDVRACWKTLEKKQDAGGQKGTHHLPSPYHLRSYRLDYTAATKPMLPNNGFCMATDASCLFPFQQPGLPVPAELPLWAKLHL